jgi:DNA-binding transcriptional regulator GbsR (MarR family)
MKTTPKMQNFISHFGEMGSRWGINRTIGQVYAVLILASEPVHADDIVSIVGVSRSNVSMALKELGSWELIIITHKVKDRKEYFSTLDDPLAIAKVLLEQRRKREIEPTLTFLRGALLDEPDDDEEYAHNKMKEIHDLVESVTVWSSEIQAINIESLHKLIKLGQNVGKLLEMKDKVLGR